MNLSDFVNVYQDYCFILFLWLIVELLSLNWFLFHVLGPYAEESTPSCQDWKKVSF